MSSDHRISKSFTLLFSFLIAFFITTVTVFFYYALEPKSPNSSLANFFANPSYSNKTTPLSSEIPKKLRIPSIGVDALVQEVGVTANGQMGIPTNFTDVAWFKLGPKPGEPGSAVIDGHLDTVRDANAVFKDLSKLKYGDVIYIEDALGQTLKFKVTETASYDIKNAPVNKIFDYNTPVAKLSLITCDGVWNQKERNYNQRFVVYSELTK